MPRTSQDVHATDAVPVYADLTPDRVLDALDGVGLRGDGRILQLNSYENRVFQLYLEDGSAVVAKFYRPGRWSDAQILEEHAFSLEARDDEIPVVAPLELKVDPELAEAPVLAGDPATLARGPASQGGYRFAVTPRRAGRAPELEDPDVLRWIGRFLGRLHRVGARRPFDHRVRLGVQTTGRGARDWLLGSDCIPPDAIDVWRSACDRALDAAQRCYEVCGEVASLRLHGDFHPGNLLWTPEGPHFVDLDEACNGPAVQDLWMLLPSEPHALRAQFELLLEGYEAFRPFDRREIALIEPLRTLRMIHHSAWIARRWKDPAFPVAFPWFEVSTYWQQQAQQLREQVEAMQALDDA
jgi:Ser/Thr protein kinase RdoA (MazF antagonist)